MSQNKNAVAPTILIAVLLGCLTLGCKTIHDVMLQQITEVRVSEVNAHHIEMDLGIELRNTRFLSGRVHDLLCDVSLTGHMIGQGHQPDPIDLPAHADSVVRIPFTVNSEEVTLQDFESIFAPEIAYSMNGTAVAEKPFNLGTVKLAVEGKFKAPAVIPVTLSVSGAADLVAFRGLRVKELGLLESSGLLKLTLRNPLRFPITLRSFHYEAISGRSKVADGDVDHDLVLQPGPNEVELPVQMHLAGIAGGILSGVSELRLPDLQVAGLAELHERDRTLQIQFGIGQSQ